MIKRLLVLIALGMMLSGCFMAPLALIGPVSSGFTTASLIQSGATSTMSYMYKKHTGKSIAEEILGALTKDALLQSFHPKTNLENLITPNSKSTHSHKN